MTIKRLGLNFLGITSLLFFLSGCYSNKEAVQELYDRQTALEARMEELIKDVDAVLSKMDADIQAVESSQAKLARDIESMKEKNVVLKQKVDKVVAKKAAKKDKAASASAAAAAKKEPPSNSPAMIYSRAVKSYNDGKFEDAILEYQRLIDTYPTDKRVPEAYLRQGMALINLGRKQEAKYFLNALIDKYPNSSEAQTAREKLNTL
ncbi:MAG TPA: tetratricopeptide repeat protein [Thermodesulfobacteriota bacterium]|nr:tetratricopeptide repeat protein [Thermodesulfobacteriota bacterium]